MVFGNGGIDDLGRLERTRLGSTVRAALQPYEVRFPLRPRDLLGGRGTRVPDPFVRTWLQVEKVSDAARAPRWVLRPITEEHGNSFVREPARREPPGGIDKDRL